MCRAVTCPTCGKVTWAGCGEHVESVMGGVSAQDRCQGHGEEPKTRLVSRLFSR